VDVDHICLPELLIVFSRASYTGRTHASINGLRQLHERRDRINFRNGGLASLPGLLQVQIMIPLFLIKVFD